MLDIQIVAASWRLAHKASRGEFGTFVAFNDDDHLPSYSSGTPTEATLHSNSCSLRIRIIRPSLLKNVSDGDTILCRACRLKLNSAIIRYICRVQLAITSTTSTMVTPLRRKGEKRVVYNLRWALIRGETSIIKGENIVVYIANDTHVPVTGTRARCRCASQVDASGCHQKQHVQVIPRRNRRQ